MRLPPEQGRSNLQGGIGLPNSSCPIGSCSSGIPEYTSGGYFLTKRFPRLKWMSAELVPGEIISLSGCVTEVIPICLDSRAGAPGAW